MSSLLLRRVALASVIANIGLVITGGAVRLTGSGLGCPTWPRCTPESYTTTPEMGVYGVIEFGNRLLTFVVGIIAVAGFVLALRERPRRRRVVTLSVLAALGIPAQAVVGGLTVLTNLNPWVVGCHFLASMAVIAAAYAFWVSAGPPAAGPAVPPPLRWLAAVLTGVTGAVLIVGTVVTGSGPHAGSADVPRNGINPESVSRVHADLVFLLIGLTVAAWFAFRALAATLAARRTGLLLLVILAQGLIGFIQYATQLPPVLVGAHVAGAALTWLATLTILNATSRGMKHGSTPVTGAPSGMKAGSPRDPDALSIPRPSAG